MPPLLCPSSYDLGNLSRVRPGWFLDVTQEGIRKKGYAPQHKFVMSLNSKSYQVWPISRKSQRCNALDCQDDVHVQILSIEIHSKDFRLTFWSLQLSITRGKRVSLKEALLSNKVTSHDPLTNTEAREETPHSTLRFAVMESDKTMCIISSAARVAQHKAPGTF